MTASLDTPASRKHFQPFQPIVRALAVVLPSALALGQPLADMSLDSFDSGCMASGCHSQLGHSPWVHAPVANTNCAACHTPVGSPEAHGFEPVKTNESDCLACHSFGNTAASSHEPFALGACNDCHNPHGGDRKSFSRFETTAGLCASCHEEPTHTFGHAPASLGDCLTCHAPHQSNHKSLLVRSQEQLCFTCHRDKDYFGLLSVYQSDDRPRYVHETLATDGCAACHAPHGGDFPAMLSNAQYALCLDCHQETIQDLPLAKSLHGAFEGEQSCTQCHLPHASEHAGLLREAPYELCMSCHDKAVKKPSGQLIPSMKQVLDESPVVHTPAANGDCATCHAPHFSSQRSLLRVDYPSQEYAEFDSGTYGMCLECHDSILMEEEYTALTGFREGDQNLHFVHINREKGRACDICHQPHAGRLPKLMREEFPFGPGGWNLPIGFSQTDTGGTCISACHEQRWYDNSYSLRSVLQKP